MAKKSFLTCEHRNQQDFTEYCFDCGYNIYTTDEEYLADLQKQARGKQLSKLHKEIRELEDVLGVTR